jgi:hypothetical protein
MDHVTTLAVRPIKSCDEASGVVGEPRGQAKLVFHLETMI